MANLTLSRCVLCYIRNKNQRSYSYRVTFYITSVRHTGDSSGKSQRMYIRRYLLQEFPPSFPGLGRLFSNFYTLALLRLPPPHLPNAAWVSLWRAILLAHWEGLSWINHRRPGIWHVLPISVYSACRISQYFLSTKAEQFNAMGQSPSWETSQEVLRILWNPKFQHFIHKTSPPDPILSQINPVRALHPISWSPVLILSSNLCVGAPNGLLPQVLPTKTLYAPLLSP